MADVQWIKLSTGIFDTSRKIKQIELMPDGDTILVIWFKLLTLAGNINDNGAIYITPKVPYTHESLANELRRPLNTVRMALSVFEGFEMIEIANDVIYLSSWEEYQSNDKLAEMREKNRERQAKFKQKQKALQGNVTVTLPVTLDNALEEEKEEEKEFHSFVLADKKTQALEKMGGSLGKGVVMLSEEQTSDLLDKLSVDEFDKYVSIVADCELKGKRYKNKSHYQAILDMVAKDRMIKGVV